MFFTKIGGTALKGIVVASIVFGSATSASANACQAGTGCVLPIADAPPPPPMEAAPPMADAGPVVTAGRPFPILAVLGGIAALAVLAYLLLSNDDDDEDLPTSP